MFSLSKDLRILDVMEPLKWIKIGYEFADLTLGSDMAQRALAIYGGGAKNPEAVPKKNLRKCAARFARFMRPDFKAARPIIEKPIQARNATQVAIAKLTLAEAKRKRKDHAKKLWNQIGAFDFLWRFSGEPQEGKADEYQKLLAEGERLLLDAAKDFGCTFKFDSANEYFQNGLSKMTFGRLDNPCARGLKELEFIING
jgi:hypothetical protein